MSVLEWKHLNLFDLVPCPHYNKLKSIKTEIIAQCANNLYAIFCDIKGWVHIFSSNCEPLSFQTPHCSTVQFCALANESNLLITLSHDSKDIKINVFNLNKTVRRTGPPCVGNGKLISSGKPTAMRSCMIENNLCIAIGFNNGEVLVHRGILSRDISSHFRWRTVCTRAITGIELSNLKSHCDMFVCSEAGIFCYTLTESSVNETKTVLDKHPSSCSSLHKRETGTYCIVGRNDAIYYYTSDGKGPCYVIEGKKKLLAAFENYLIVVVEYPMSSLHQITSQLIIIDITNNMIVFIKEMESITNVIIENNNSCVVTISKEILLLLERDIDSKIRLFMRKNLYDKAIRLLQNNENYNHNLGKLYLEYGNYLLNKGDANGALDKYVKTIGLVDPYCVIQKLLDSRNNLYLSEYLHKLIKSEYSTDDHIELLASCSDRLDLPFKIANICSEEHLQTNEPCNSNFGVIKCKNLSTFINIVNDDKQIKHFFKQMSENKIYEFFIDISQSLMKQSRKDVTNILKEMCTKGRFLDIDVRISQPERFIPMLMANKECCIDFLENIIQYNDHCSQTIYNFLLEMYLRQWRIGEKREEDISLFLKKYSNPEFEQHTLILCRNYSFWPGIMHMYENYMQNRLCVRYRVRNTDLYNSAINQTKQCINLFMRIQALSGDVFNCNNTIQLANNFLNVVLEEENQSILQVLHAISGNSNVQVVHIKEFFTQEHLQKVTVSNQQSEIASTLYGDLDSVNTLLTNYAINPIEFRSSVCNVCRKQLKLPAIYFLCQHSFHKECLSSTSNCIICTANVKEIISKFNVEVIKNDERVDDTTSLTDIASVSKYLALGIFKKYVTKRQQDQTSINKITVNTTKPFIWEEVGSSNLWPGRLTTQVDVNKRQSKTSNNPFDNADTYDTNLNPFDD